MDVRRLLEVKDFNRANNRTRTDSVGSDDSDRSDLSTQSMPQYSSYRQLSGGLFGPFEKPASRPGSRTSFLPFSLKKGSPEMSTASKLKIPGVKPRGAGEGSSRPSSRSGARSESATPGRPSLSREGSESKLPVYRREASLPQIKRESSIPLIRREKSEINKAQPATTRTSISGLSKTTSGLVKPASLASTRGTNVQITPKSTPKTVAQRKVEERNIPAKGTRSGVSGFSEIVMIGDRVSINATEKKGVVQFVGETKFAKGTWAGIVLDDATGKNDGSVAGVRYFSCPKLQGVFVKEDKLKKIGDPRDIGFSPHGPLATPKTSFADRSLASRNDSSMSTDSGVEEEHDLTLGDSVIISSVSGERQGALRYVGLTGFAKGTWCGVELSEPTGKNDGAVAGTRYFQCESKHGIFAQLHKVKKLNSSSESESPFDKTPSKPPIGAKTENKLRADSTSRSQQDVLSSDVDSTTQAVEVAILHDEVLNTTPLLRNSSLFEASLNETIEDQAKKIASLELLLYKRDEEIQKIYENQEKSQNSEHEKQINEHQEKTLRLQSSVNQLEREKLELQNVANENKQRLEDVQFQLEEQLMLAGEEEKGPSKSNIENILGLEEKLKSREAEIVSFKNKLEKFQFDVDEGLIRLSDKDSQITLKEDEVMKLRDLNSVAKDNENLLHTEITNLKQQLQQLRDLKLSVSDTEREHASSRNEFEAKLLERDRKVSDMQDTMEELKSAANKTQKEIQDKDTTISDLQIQLVKLREDLNETVEGKGALNIQILELNNDLGSKRNELTTLQASVEQFQKENLEVKAKLEASNGRCEQFIEDKKRLEEDILKVSKNSGDSAQQLVYLNHQIQAKNSDITSLQDKLSTLTSEYNKQSQEIVNLNEKYTKEKQGLEKDKNHEISKLKSSFTLLEDHFEKLKVQKEEIEVVAVKEKQELQQSVNAVANLDQLTKDREDKLKTKEDEITKLSQQITQITADQNKSKEQLYCAQKDVQCKTNEVEKLKENINKINEELKISISSKEQLKKDLDKTTKEKKDFERLYDSITLEGEHVRKENQVIADKLAKVLTKAENISKEKEELQDDLNKKLNDISKLQIERDESNRKLEESVTNVKATEEKLSEVKRQIADGSSSVQDLHLKLEKSNEQTQKVIDENKTIEKEKSDLLKKHLELIKEKDTLFSDITTNKTKSSELESQCTLLREQVQQALDRETTVRTTLESDRTQLKDEVELAKNSVNTLNKEINHLKAKITELETKNEKLSNQQTSIQENIVSTGSDRKLQDELQKINEAKLEQEKEVDFLNSIIVDLQKKNKSQEEKIKILSFGDDEVAVQEFNDTMSPLKPGVRVRLFCDICDVFDLHDTEDCPLQSNDDSGSQYHGDRGSERPFCTTCEMFGHIAENCDEEEMF